MTSGSIVSCALAAPGVDVNAVQGDGTTAAYLMSTPLMPDLIEEGLAELGLDRAEVEKNRM